MNIYILVGMCFVSLTVWLQMYLSYLRKVKRDERRDKDEQYNSTDSRGS